MALVVLIILGASLGWLASVLGRSEAAGSILRQIALGIVVCLIAGFVMNSGSVLGGLSLMALGVACGAAIAGLVVYHLIFERNLDKDA